MWMLSGLDQFKRIALWVSNIAVVASISNFVMAGFFDAHRATRIFVSVLILFLALVVRRSALTFDVDKQRAIEAIEKAFYATVFISILSGAYIFWNESDLRSGLGLLLVSINLAVGICVFFLIKKNISNAKSF